MLAWSLLIAPRVQKPASFMWSMRTLLYLIPYPPPMSTLLSDHFLIIVRAWSIMMDTPSPRLLSNWQLLNGFFIGLTINHSAADGTSFAHFILTSSKIFRSQQPGENLVQISQVALYKMNTPSGHGPIFKLPYLEREGFTIRYNPGPFREKIFHFPPINGKALCQDQWGMWKPSYIFICGLGGLLALVWGSTTRAHNLPGHEKTSCILPSNADPHLTHHYQIATTAIY